MKQLRELKRYCLDNDEYLGPGLVCVKHGEYLKYSDVEELVSELDDVFENCKMELESAKATIEELQEKLNRMKCDYGTVEPDELEGFGGHGQW